MTRLRNAHPSTYAIAALAVFAFVVIQQAGHGLIFFVDEWNVIVHRQAWNPGEFLRPHGEHLIAPTLLIFRVLLETVGMAPYWPYRLIETALVVLCIVLVWAIGRRRLDPWEALVPATLVAIVGASSQVLLWPFEMQFVISLACGLGIALLIDRRDGKAQYAVCALLVLALASSSIGLSVFAATAVAILGAPDRRKRLWILAVPFVLYAAWWLPYHHQTFVAENIGRTPNYVVDSLGAALRATFGATTALTEPLVIAWILLCAIGLLRARTREDRLALLSVLTLGVTFWILAGVGRADRMEAAASRYMFAGALFVTLPLIEVARGWRIPRLGWGVALAGALALLVFVQVPRLHEGAADIRSATAVLGPELAAVEIAGPALPAGLQIDSYRAPLFDVGPYLAAVRAYGSPVDATRQLRSGAESGRMAADALLIRGGAITAPTDPARCGPARVALGPAGRRLLLAAARRVCPRAP